MDQKVKWYKNAVVYQIYPMSFKDSNQDGIGDIQGIISKLDYLKDLGVDVIWLSPIYESPMQDNGYDISDYKAINPMFGTMEDALELIEKTHQKGMKIIMDLVINHTSSQHKWFLEAIQNKNSKYRDYYIWSDVPTDVDSIFGGSAWTFEPKTKQYYFHLFADQQPDLNWRNPALRLEIYQMINEWLDLGIDGFRLDVIDLIGKDVFEKKFADGPFLDTYLNELYEACFKGRDIMTVGETPGISIERASEITNDKDPKLNMVFQFSHVGLDEVANQGKWVLRDINLIEMKHVFNKVQHTFHKKGWNALFLANHDQPRVVSRYGSLIYREESAKMLATMIYGMQGTPYIYQGEEIGMTGIQYDIEEYKDIETLQIYDILKEKGWTHNEIMNSIYKKSRDNSRTPFQWDDSHQAGFTESSRTWLKVNPNYLDINAKENIEDSDSVYHYFKDLLKLRKSDVTFLKGSFELYKKEDPNIFSYYRTYKNNKYLMICSWSDQNLDFELPSKNFEIKLSNYHQIKITDRVIKCPPFFTAVIKLEESE